ncbi:MULTISPECIES: tryptophan synthase subunit alpha [unclassified Exiguobacterium]|uniref:tryptophan synthase subunit alpha n=1 Tax=unclassified Exiguobacterium TaxID=2644629 RepID=UPI000B58747A|nr:MULTISPECIES: tryptophan synthase subunit alpha [unclassified Exiguobacterium]ASI34888.1 tryptophan synthase subunit alpha [Exiguobacterium sp. N4-1P]
MRLEQAIRTVNDRGEKAFIPYVMGGDGGIDRLPDILAFLERSGATAIEVGVPFSDPVADGPVIQEAGLRALAHEVSLHDVLEAIRVARQETTVPIVVMTYLNPIFRFGIDAFLATCREVGVDGLIIPDLPLEQSAQFFAKHDKQDIALVQLVSLTSPIERIQKIANQSEGFLYAVTVNGTTGGQTTFGESLEAHLANVAELSPVPVLAGFGISTPAHVKQLGASVAGVIVGSKIVELLQQEDTSAIEQLMAARLPDLHV